MDNDLFGFSIQPFRTRGAPGDAKKDLTKEAAVDGPIEDEIDGIQSE